ncbi:hypothetical protein CPB83DRAFT_833797 [Crepidotus variabilis]|uniref:Uncharacterized protein n=1 Tax=Crepidotus variabilis TaxID=179855 RepID=A0A9P6ELU1_9AGAR|nr:hypothetical protein CPB83DRAFT_833797 [Crepidotus variabilis]
MDTVLGKIKRSTWPKALPVTQNILRVPTLVTVIQLDAFPNNSSGLPWPLMKTNASRFWYTASDMSNTASPKERIEKVTISHLISLDRRSRPVNVNKACRQNPKVTKRSPKLTAWTNIPTSWAALTENKQGILEGQSGTAEVLGRVLEASPELVAQDTYRRLKPVKHSDDGRNNLLDAADQGT